MRIPVFTTMKQNPAHFLHPLMAALLATGTAAPWCRAQGLPPADAWHRLHQQCGDEDNPDWLPAFTKQNSASGSACSHRSEIQWGKEEPTERPCHLGCWASLTER